jgi:hypothetical protein
MCLIIILLATVAVSVSGKPKELTDAQKTEQAKAEGRKIIEKLLDAYKQGESSVDASGLWWGGKTRSALRGVRSYELIGFNYDPSYPRMASFYYRVTAKLKDGAMLTHEWLIVTIQEKKGSWKVARLADPLTADSEMPDRSIPSLGYKVFTP